MRHVENWLVRTKADIYCPEVGSPLIFLLNLFSFPSQLTFLWTKFISCLKPPTATEIKEVKETAHGISWAFICPIPPHILKDHFEVMKYQGLGLLQLLLHFCCAEASLGTQCYGSKDITCGLGKGNGTEYPEENSLMLKVLEPILVSERLLKCKS